MGAGTNPHPEREQEEGKILFFHHNPLNVQTAVEIPDAGRKQQNECARLLQYQFRPTIRLTRNSRGTRFETENVHDDDDGCHRCEVRGTR